MIRHIVMFRTPGNNTDSDTLMLKDKLDGLKNKIPQIQYLKTGVNLNSSPNAFNLVLETEFINNLDMEIYRQHPEHVAVVALIKELNCEIAVVDYEI